jgi:hypothetical protein
MTTNQIANVALGKPRTKKLIQALAVVSQEVIDIELGSSSAYGRHLLEASMRSMPIVLMYPWFEVGVSFLGVLVEPGVCPFSDCGLDEVFGFSVGSRSIDACSDVPGIEGVALSFEAVGDKTGSVVGHDAAQLDVESSEVFGCLAQEKAGGNRLFIGHHDGEGDAG